MFKCYRQIEHSDCGLTCIRMVARHYGAKISSKYMQQISDLNRLGMSIKDMTDCCNKIGIDSRAVRIRPEHIAGMPLPAVLYWQQRHFVVLYGYDSRRHRYRIADPAQGKMTYCESDFLGYWIQEGSHTGLAVLMEPSEKFGKCQYGRTCGIGSFFRYIYGFMATHKVSFFLALIISILIMAADFTMPLLLKQTVDDGIGMRDVGLVVMLLLVQLAIAAGGLVSSYGMDYVLTRAGLKIHIDMVDSFLKRLALFPLSFFDRKVSSDFVKKMDDHTRIKDFLLTFPNSMLSMFLTLVVFSVLLFYYSKTIFCLFIVMSVLEVLWNTLFLNRRKTLDYAYFINASENSNHAYELANGMADLKVNNAESAKIGKWKSTQENINSISMKSSLLSMAQGGGHTVISRLKDLIVTGFGAVMVIGGDMTFGTLMTLGYITGRLSQPFSTLGTSISSLQNAYISYQRVDDVINDDIEKRGDVKFSEASISFQGVGFKYPGASSPFVIKDFDLKIERGSFIALVGESGCGKSTLIKLMLGFYVPQKGCLTLSGTDVRDIDNQDWLRHCGAVMQEAKIFSGTILENISLSDNCPDEKKVISLLSTVGLNEFVSSLPMGIHTTIGSTGIEMSGGQKQRLMIARALYKDPEMLFLDEATSSLDANNERSVVSKLNALGEGKTIVVAAHRLSTVQNADKIIVIKDGRIVEEGSHDELIALKGRYWRLVKNQLQLSI